MGLTMVLLALLYVVLILAIGYFTNAIWLGILIGLGVLWAQWYFSDKLALSAMRAREVSPAEAPQLHAIVDRLCALANVPKPRVAIANTELPNAFAAGRSPDRAVLCATTGLMRRLDERELEAVLSHELSHVAHRDVTVMTIASVVGVLAGFMTRALFFGGIALTVAGTKNGIDARVAGWIVRVSRGRHAYRMADGPEAAATGPR
jgi:heat shock protein HtpX